MTITVAITVAITMTDSEEATKPPIRPFAGSGPWLVLVNGRRPPPEGEG
ncbi:MAG: hypothetical protein QOJ15_11649 [Bradyrhizobium sp.]|jgi:hypothetical protein|nr:hypothetical protein [Bradyrhizobium sp.]